MRVFLAFISLATLAACQETFVPPDRPDLAKTPLVFDLSVGGPSEPRPDLSAQAPPADLAAPVPDLATSHDLSVPVPDLKPADKDAS